MDPLLPNLEAQLPTWLAKQRWFAADGDLAQASVSRHEWLAEGRLLWTLVDADGATYQVLIGLSRPEDLGGTLLGHGDATICNTTIEGVDYVAYDALVDPKLCISLLQRISPTESVRVARAVGAEQSNTSIVYDDRLIVKYFRRLYEGSNPDLEVTQKLTEASFPNIAPVLATWQHEGFDLAVCQPFLRDGTEGWKLAINSVRDFLGADTTGGSSPAGSPSVRLDPTDPAEAGGDFAGEARRLGDVTARMHLSLAEKFGTEPFDPSSLVNSLSKSLDGLSTERRSTVESLLEELSTLRIGDAGAQTRIHGDYHLGQTMRAVGGWYVFDFEGEPARPLSERVCPTSPLKDVAGMIRSFGYAASSNLFDWSADEQVELQVLADRWEVRNRETFREAYMCVDGISALLPETASACDLVFRAFEVEKALYELAYEQSYRPGWVAIPERALDRLLS